MTDQHLISVNIEDEMRKSYLDYAMSVIVGRALPDVRDGLKPVHRRILFAMHDLGNAYNKAYKKSARIVGDVIGKYHPHGDSAVYDALVRMAQEFNMRYMLVDGQGNFGSIDGDNAAAMRYTEVRMARLASILLDDIDKNTVDFGPNYDDSLQEPLVLPSKVPNLLMNGSDGIAVGMATKIPPHNLRELISGLIALIENPHMSLPELMKHIPGPDFPTGGFILGIDKIKEAYETGRGVIQMRAKAHTETHPRTGRSSIVIDQIPYQTNKARLIENIAELVADKKVEGISDLRDESDREGMRVVIEIKRGENADVILNRLYKMTAMQSSFGINMVSLVNGQPRQMGITQMLLAFISFRREVVTRRTHFLLEKARARAHILEGLVIALDNLDAVIKLIRESRDPAIAKEGLISNFKLSVIQAQAILDMRLQRLTGLERQKIMDEYKEVLATIADLEDILAKRERIDAIIVDELTEAGNQFGDARRTEIVADHRDLTVEDLIADEEMVVTISHRGYIKANPATLYRSQRRGGKGSRGMAVREEDFVEQMFTASAHSYILFFSDTGQLYWLKVHEVPQASRAAKGKPIVNLLNLKTPDEQITAYLPVREFVEGRYVVMVTNRGTIKKTDLMAFSNPRSVGIAAMDLDEGEKLINVLLTTGDDHLFISTRNGQSIRFSEHDVRAMGRTAHGVRGISLEEGDEAISTEVVSAGADLLTISERGYGKRTSVEEYRAQGRGGKGILTMKVTEKTGGVAGVLQVPEDSQVMLVTSEGNIIRTNVNGISRIGRSTQGVRIMRMSNDETVVAIARLADRDDDDDGEEGAEGTDAEQQASLGVEPDGGGQS